VTASIVSFTTGASTAEPPDAAHLRRLIERQPSCLLRVGLDGLLLAVNDAALQLLGAKELAQVLGTSLTALILGPDHEQWEALAARVREGSPASTECELTDLAGTRRTVLLHAVPLLDHPDGVPSMILAARDSSAPRRIESALRSREVRQELGDLQKQLISGFAGQSKPAAPPGDADARDQQHLADHAAELATLRRTLEEAHERALLLKQQEWQRSVDHHKSELEQHKLAVEEHKRELEQNRIALDHHRTDLHQRTTDLEERKLELAARQAEIERKQIDLTKALTDRDEVAKRLADEQRDRQQLVARHAMELAQLRQTLAEEHQLALLLKEQEFRGRIDAANAQHMAARAAAEQRIAALSATQAAIEKAFADQRVELEALDENARSLECLAGVGRAALAATRELETMILAVEAHTEFLLARTAVDADDREAIEALRGEAITAASLVRQIIQANPVPRTRETL
jgi:PAS domain S-box-containing protein